MKDQNKYHNKLSFYGIQSLATLKKVWRADGINSLSCCGNVDMTGVSIIF